MAKKQHYCPKRLLFRAFFGMEVILFITWYIYGPEGTQKRTERTCAIEKIEGQCHSISYDIHDLEKQIHAWNTSLFLYEKVAREKLCMGRDGEETYLYKSIPNVHPIRSH